MEEEQEVIEDEDGVIENVDAPNELENFEDEVRNTPMNFKLGADVIGGANQTSGLHFNFNEDAVNEALESPFQDTESPTAEQEYRSHNSSEEQQ